MSTPKETPFTAYDFSDEEIKHAMQFNPTQKQYLQTLLSEVAMVKLAESFDGKDPIKFAQMEAWSRGQMDMLNTLLAERVLDSDSNPYADKQAEAPNPVTPQS